MCAHIHAGILGVLLGLAFQCTQNAEADDLVSFNLDSLCYLSSNIVEGTIAATAIETSRDDTNLPRLKVTAVYKGTLHRGQEIGLSGTRDYEPPTITGTPGKHEYSWEKGTRLFVFLRPQQPDYTRTERNYIAWHDPDPGSPHLVPSGIKVVISNKVHTFFQLGNPGDYCIWQYSSPFGPNPTLEAFREVLSRRIAAVERTAVLLAEPLTTNRVPVLLRLFKESTTSPDPWAVVDSYGRDFFRVEDRLLQVASEKLQQLGDPGAIAAALDAEPLLDRSARRTLYGGFGTVAGQEFLMQAITDEKIPREKRLQFIKGVTRWALTKPWMDGPGILPLSRYVSLIRAISQDEEFMREYFTARLLVPIYWQFSTNDVDDATWPEAHRILHDLYTETSSEQVKGLVAFLVATIDPTASREFGSFRPSVILPCSPVFDTHTGTNRLLRFEMLAAPIPESSYVQTNLILKSVTTSDCSSHPNGWLPATQPGGLYHAYLEYRHADGSVTRGYGFDVDVPPAR